MSYQALYRKWRPSVFEDVVSQNHIVSTLKNQINTNKIAHAYLFCGSRGTGKTSTAKIFSRAVNCENPVNGNPCNQCDTCKGILSGSIFDVVEIDGASNNKVDDIRNIRDEVVYPPADCKYKVYIIDEVHMLTTEAFNALLKTLEEPPSYVIFILATTEFHKIPATIISRCQKFDFKRITYKDTSERIKKVAQSDNIKISDSAVKLLAKAADGSLRDGLSKLDQCLALGLSEIDCSDVATVIGASDPEFLSAFCDSIIDRNLKEALKYLDDGVNMGIDPMRLYTDTIDYFRDLLMIKTSKDYSLVVNTEEEIIKKYEEQCSKLTLPRILKIIENLFEGQNMAKYLASPKLSFETALLKTASLSTETDADVLLERVNALEEKLRYIELNGVKAENTSLEISEEPHTEIAENSVKEEEYSFNDDNDEDEEEYVFDEEPINEEEFTSPEIYIKEEQEEKIPQFSADEYEEEFVFNEEETEEEIPMFFESEPVIDIPVSEEKEEIEEEITDTELSEIALNFREFMNNMKNKDMGFDIIVRPATVYVKNNSLVIDFPSKTSYDIAKSNKYDSLIIASAKENNNLDIAVTLTYDDKSHRELKPENDPFDDIIEIAQQNQLIFNFEE